MNAVICSRLGRGVWENPAMRILAACGIGALLIGLGIAGSASAQSPPTLNPSTSVAECNGAIEDPVSCSLDGATATVQRTPFALITASANGAPGTFASASLSFDFLVTGGTAGDVVTVGLTTTMMTSLTGQGSGFGQVVWNDSVANSQKDLCSSTLTAATACVFDAPGLFDGTITFAAVSGEVGQINLDVDAGTGFGGTGFASIDPFMFVESDPTGIYSLQISSDVKNALPTTGGVPEPAAWALMLAGFGLAGTALRRQRKMAHG
jgi:hypothetical protein